MRWIFFLNSYCQHGQSIKENKNRAQYFSFLVLRLRNKYPGESFSGKLMGERDQALIATELEGYSMEPLKEKPVGVHACTTAVAKP